MKFVNKENALTLKEVAYWKKIFNERLIFGSEIEFESRCNANSRAVRDRFIIDSTFGIGVEYVESDGSLRSGGEVKTRPRHVDSFIQLFSVYKGIIDKLEPVMPMVNTRAGWHNHISLNNYGGMKSNEMNIPFVIVKNIIALFKHYYPALKYFTASMPESQACYTRNDRFCLTRGLLNTDDDMNIYDLLEEIEDDTRYNALNCRGIETYSNNISAFHVETRFPDCNLFPFSMASYQILVKALILKAIELSTNGEISLKIDNETKRLYSFANSVDAGHTESYINRNDLLDEEASDRGSRMVTDEVIELIKQQGTQLLDILKPEIDLIDEKAFDFIAMLMDKPIYQMFRELNTEDIYEINDKFEEIIDNAYEIKEVSQEAEQLASLISLNSIKAETKEEWKNAVGEIVNFNVSLDEILEEINSYRKLKFIAGTGYYFC